MTTPDDAKRAKREVFYARAIGRLLDEAPMLMDVEHASFDAAMHILRTAAATRMEPRVFRHLVRSGAFGIPYFAVNPVKCIHPKIRDRVQCGTARPCHWCCIYTSSVAVTRAEVVANHDPEAFEAAAHAIGF